MSKLSDLDHIQRIKDSLEKAIAEGTSFDNWRKENLADLQGLPKSYQETVFRTAVQSSYNAGRWAHFRDHAERRPILRYGAGAVRRHQRQPHPPGTPCLARTDDAGG